MAGWNQTSELVVGGSGQAYVAATVAEGSLPTTTTGALNAAFVGLGLHSEDGVSLTVTPNIQEFPVWQSRQPGRRESLAQEISQTFSLAQWDEDTVPLAFGGGVISGSSPNFKYDFPDDDDALDERSLIVDVVDGSRTFRFVWRRGNVTEATTSAFNRSNLALLPIGFKALAPSTGGSPGYFLTNAAGFTAGS